MACQKWIDSLGNLIYADKIKKQSKVCELHFNDDDIQKFDEFNIKDGSTVRLKRCHITLRKTAIPSGAPKKYTISIDNEVLFIMPFSVFIYFYYFKILSLNYIISIMIFL